MEGKEAEWRRREVERRSIAVATPLYGSTFYKRA
jgi:hypothetical protein